MNELLQVVPGLLSANPWVGPVFTLGYLIAEYWLGRTDKVKAGSTLELGLTVAKKVFAAVRKNPPSGPK